MGVNCPHGPGADCNKGGDDAEPASATFAIGMVYSAAELFTVGVGTDSNKKIQVGNSDFFLNEPIMMNFGIDPRFPEGDCVPHNAAALGAGDATLENMAAELNGANIAIGFFEAQMDRKRSTGSINFGYVSPALGDVRIHVGGFPSPQPPTVSEVVVEDNDGNPVTNILRFSGKDQGGFAAVRQLTPGGAMTDPIIRCRVKEPSQVFVTLTINR